MVVSRLRRALFAISALATLWTIVLLLTGGVVVPLPGVSISSRNPRNPALVAVVAAAVALWLPMEDRRRATREWWLGSRRLLRHIAAGLPAWAEPAIVMAAVGAVLQVDVWSFTRPLWLDEEMIAINVRDRSFAQLAGPLWLDQAAPFGWLVLERVAIALFGTGEKALRAVPLLFSVATLVVAAWAGRRWLGRLAGTTFVLLCAVNPWLAHYSVEVKHYSADAFWALVLPLAAVWAVEGREPRDQLRRARAWWAMAAVAHWFSNGGLLVLPACAIVLLLVLWRRVGRRALEEAAVGGVVLLGSFALHYWLSIRHTIGSDYLRTYWSGGLPPESAGLAATLAWLLSQFRPLAANPVGTEWWLLLWVVAIAGAISAPSALRLVVPLVPLSAFVLGGLAVVPLLDRVAMWMVPALYLGAASLVDLSMRVAGKGVGRHRRANLLIAAAMVAAAFLVCADIVDRGWQGFRARRAHDNNHGLDDRSAVRWLMAERQPDDALVTTHMGLPAVWWYGGVAATSGTPPGSAAPDGGAIIEASQVSAAECASGTLPSTWPNERRALVYVGFPDAPQSFADLLVETLASGGAVEQDRMFADASRAAVIALGRGRPAGTREGCVQLRAASRW